MVIGALSCDSGLRCIYVCVILGPVNGAEILVLYSANNALDGDYGGHCQLHQQGYIDVGLVISEYITFVLTFILWSRLKRPI